MTTKNTLLIRVLAAVSFVVMVSVNILANVLPINDVKTADISSLYDNLFAPAGYTFAIWGLIYLLLACYTLYQMGLFQPKDAPIKSDLFGKIGIYFIISSLANAAWIFAWHYDQIAISVVLMAVILVSLIMISRILIAEELSARESAFIRVPFSVYFGWITIATIANITTFLVSLGWNGFGISDAMWTVIMIAIGLLISGANTWKNKDIAYGLTVIWALVGILVKHLSTSGYGGFYTSVIATCIASIVLLLGLVGYIVYTNREKWNLTSAK